MHPVSVLQRYLGSQLLGKILSKTLGLRLPGSYPDPRVVVNDWG